MIRRAAPAVALVATWLVTTSIGPFSSTEVNDLYVYSVYAELIRDGLVPYRDFAFEYPPLAAVPIAALGGDETAWSLAMLACALVCQWCVGALSGTTAAWLMAALPVLAGAMVRTHFDLLPAALVLLALVASAGRQRWCGALLGAATMTKLWPLVVAPAGIFTRRGFAFLVLAILAVGLPALAVGAWDLVDFHLRRPIQIESTPASLLFALGGSHVTGHPVLPDEFKSNGLAGGAAGVVAPIFTGLQIATILFFAVNARRAPLVGALGATLAFVALGKVLSPQYMLWLFPLAVSVGGLPAALVVAATALTQVEFPNRYFDLVAEDPAMIIVVAARNLLLLAAVAVLAIRLVKTRSTARAPARSRPPAAAPST